MLGMCLYLKTNKQNNNTYGRLANRPTPEREGNAAVVISPPRTKAPAWVLLGPPASLVHLQEQYNFHWVRFNRDPDITNHVF